MENPTERQISSAISLCQMYWSRETESSSREGQTPARRPSPQEQLLSQSAREGLFTRGHMNLLLETPLVSSSPVPALIESAIMNAGNKKPELIDTLYRFCNSPDLTVRFNASFSMILVSKGFPALVRMFRLQSLASSNLAESRHKAILDAAADELVKMCGETNDEHISTSIRSFFNEHSLLFSGNIKRLPAPSSTPSRSPINKRGLSSKVGVPSNYPEVSRRPSLLGMGNNRKKLSAILPPPGRKGDLSPGLKIPSERY
jgi:hypothetical protein